MPCNEVSEYVQVTLDQADRLQSFALQKNTCGAPVGNALLLSYARNVTANELLGMSLLDLVPELYEARHLDQFLLNKQFIALQSAMAVYTGRASGGLDDLFVVESIVFEGNAARISGLLKVDVVADKIRACGNCGCKKKATETDPKQNTATT